MRRPAPLWRPRSAGPSARPRRGLESRKECLAAAAWVSSVAHRRQAKHGENASTHGASMNLAHWLDRAGRDDPQRPALGLGLRVLRTYGETAGRVARLAGALRGFGLEPGDRVAIVARNSPDYVELLYAVWHAGLAAVPANAKLHGAELGYILEQSGARLCFASEGLDGEIAAHAPKSLER